MNNKDNISHVVNECILIADNNKEEFTSVLRIHELYSKKIMSKILDSKHKNNIEYLTQNILNYSQDQAISRTQRYFQRKQYKRGLTITNEFTRKEYGNPIK